MKQNVVQVNAFKKSSHIIKRGSYFERIIFTVANLRSDTNTTENSTDSILQIILALSSDTLKDTLFHLGRKIIDLPNLNNHTVTVDITKRWVKHIIEEGAMTVLKAEDTVREILIA